MFLEDHIKVLTRVELYDHYPIMISLSCNAFSKVTKHFRFESAWLLDGNYIERLMGVWKDNDGLGRNLKKIEDNSKAWKCGTLNEVYMRKKEIMARLNGAQKCIQRKDNMGA